MDELERIKQMSPEQQQEYLYVLILDLPHSQ